jgi:tRNA threonylcarbamoyladenosine biosynthesis protein TsaB
MRSAGLSERLLAIDTTFGACSAAVLQGKLVLAKRFEVMQRGHAEALAPMVEAVMREAGLAFADLDKLAVTTGPGSFTGQRVGLAFMRGLKVALSLPLVGVTSLAAMAAEALADSGLEVAAAVHDAKRGEVYIETTAGLAAQVMTIAEAQRVLSALPSLALAGTGAVLMASVSARVLPITAPDAVWVARLAADAAVTGTPPRPLYLRAPDAKLPKAIPAKTIPERAR